MMDESRRIDRAAPLFTAMLALLFLFPLLRKPAGFAFFPGLNYSDLAITHWPNAALIKHAITTWKQVPLWNPLIYAGAPFAADPLSGLWYLPLWLTQIIPITIAFNLLFAAHLTGAGWGVYRLLRAEGIPSWGALLGAVSFMGASKWIAHIGLGHLTFVFAVSWTPWLLLAAYRLSSEDHAWKRWAAAGGGFAALIALADPRWVIPAGILAAVYACMHSIQAQRRTNRILFAGGLSLAVAALLSAPLSLPLLEFIPLSTRAALTAADQAYFSLPLSGLLGVLFPITSQPEWIAYLGPVVLLLAVLGLVNGGRKNTWYWAATAIISLVLALGDSTPLFSALTWLPGFNLLRVPPRLIFLTALSLSMLAGHGLWAILEGVRGKELVRSRLAVAGVTSLTLLLGTAMSISMDAALRPSLTLTMLAGALSAGWAFFSLSSFSKRTIAAIGWILLAVLDLGRVDAGLLEVRAAEDVLSTESAVAESIAADELQRSFSPSYSIPQQTAALFGIQLADGISPMQLQIYAEAISEAIGLHPSGYSVTLPVFTDGDPAVPQNLELDLELLGRLNVAWIVSAYPLDAPDLERKAGIDNVWVYVNPYVRPRAWVEPDSGGAGSWQPIISMAWTPNRIEIRAEGPGKLVLSEIQYPGWEIRMDGARVAADEGEHLLRSVELPAGEHEVVFQYRPWRPWTGLGLSLLGLCCLAWLWRRR
ncbi:MAG: hypothetical protein JXA97_05645 [Anaerolineales bacterium]|nr:hypothetical protein [Anaerolineales bacterium]